MQTFSEAIKAAEQCGEHEIKMPGIGAVPFKRVGRLIELSTTAAFALPQSGSVTIGTPAKATATPISVVFSPRASGRGFGPGAKAATAVAPKDNLDDVLPAGLAAFARGIRLPKKTSMADH